MPLLCEDVKQEVIGNFIILGVIGYIQVTSALSAFKLCVFNDGRQEFGAFTESVRLHGT